MANSLPRFLSVPARLLAASVILLAACNGETPKPRDAKIEKPPGVGAPAEEKEGPLSPGTNPAPRTPSTNPPPAAPAPPAPPAKPGAAAAAPATTAPPAAATGSAALSGKLAAKVLYLERMMLPPDCTVKAQLVDVSRADAPAVVLAEQSAATKTAPPYIFELAYDPAKIDPRNTYAVSARIERDGKLMYASDTRHGVLTRGAPMDAVEVVVKRLEEPQK